MSRVKCVAALIIAGLTMVGCGNDSSSSNEQVPNTAPNAVADTATAWVGTPVTIDVLANDTDAENDPLTLFDFVIVEGEGSVSQAGNVIVFTPEVAGQVLIDYTIVDPSGAKGIATVTVTVMQHDLEFVGSATCIGCHQDKQSFFETGHNFKLNKVENGEAPNYPFSSLEGAVELFHGVTNTANPGDYNWTWDDISYVIGGYDTWANFLDKDGYILAGDGVAVSMPQNGEAISASNIMNYKPDITTPDTEVFDCGLCHSTGWKDYTPNSPLNPYRQDGLKGFGGTFNQAGIQCEACHGAGSLHAKTESAADISRVAKGRLAEDLRQDDMGYGMAMTCAECHTKQTNRFFPDYISEHNRDFGEDRVAGRTIPYFDGGRVAGDAMAGLDPDTGEPVGKKRNMACHTCHDPHMSMNYAGKPGHEQPLQMTCTDCHADKSFSTDLTAHQEVACTTCHMPKANHLFAINLEYASNDPRNFSKENPATNTKAGQFVQPWNVAKDSCGSCHKADYDERAAKIMASGAKKMHN